MKKVGIITFHNSYNCGSMLESYAMQESIQKYCNKNVEIIDFSNEGQRKLYGVWFENSSIKNIIKNILLLPNIKRIKNNNLKYKKFKEDNFILSSKEYCKLEELDDKYYEIVVSGSDQIWNITIDDADEAYFLPWVKKAKKVAYAPSFGAKNILVYSDTPKKYINYLKGYDALSIRENNGKKWIKEMINKDVPVLIDPTLLLSAKEYEKIMAKDIEEKSKYIFLYCPNFNVTICKFVKKIAKKYNLKVITWSCKSYSIKLIRRFGFCLAKYENPSSYLYYIKNAELVLTTSFHGTIFSTIFKKKFITIKNGDMYGDDDRVITLLSQIKMLDRLKTYEFNKEFNYMSELDYSNYNNEIDLLKKKAIKFLVSNIGDGEREKYK